MIDIDLVPIKYITGSYKYESTYPTKEDFMWDMVCLGKKSVGIDTITHIEKDVLDSIIETLEKEKYIKTSSNKISIIKTPWDGKSDKQ